MDDIPITKIGPIVTEPATDDKPALVSIELLTSDGQTALEMPVQLAVELAAALVRHLREEQSLSSENPLPSKES